MSTKRLDFAFEILRLGGWPTHINNHVALIAWMAGESTAASNNPLATTQPMPGATNFNFADVKNYISMEQGVEATVKTIRNGKYGPIIASLRAHNAAAITLKAVEASPWGTKFGGDTVGFVEGVRARWSLYAFKTVPPFVS